MSTIRMVLRLNPKPNVKEPSHSTRVSAEEVRNFVQPPEYAYIGAVGLLDRYGQFFVYQCFDLVTCNSREYRVCDGALLGTFPTLQSARDFAEGAYNEYRFNRNQWYCVRRHLIEGLRGRMRSRR